MSKENSRVRNAVDCSSLYSTFVCPERFRDDVAADLGVAGADRVVLGLRARNVRLREKSRNGV